MSGADIPLLDWGRAESDPAGFAAAISAAVRGPGFFLLAGSDIPEDLRARAFAEADAFFALPAERKEPLAITRNPHNRGWVRAGDERLDAASGHADRKEAFNIGLDLAPDDPRVLAGEPFRGVNVWPPVQDFAEAMRAYYDAALAQGLALHRVFAADLGLERDHFAPSLAAPMATLRLLHYPAREPGDAGPAAGAHTDYGAITLLLTDGEPGLQVRPRGDAAWRDVPHVPGAYVVNIGDCLMRWTNDVYVSTPHRVLPPARERRSIAFFLDPDPGAVIAALPGTGPARYPAVTGADYLRSRLDATYGGGA